MVTSDPFFIKFAWNSQFFYVHLITARHNKMDCMRNRNEDSECADEFNCWFFWENVVAYPLLLECGVSICVRRCTFLILLHFCVWNSTHDRLFLRWRKCVVCESDREKRERTLNCMRLFINSIFYQLNAVSLAYIGLHVERRINDG